MFTKKLSPTVKRIAAILFCLIICIFVLQVVNGLRQDSLFFTSPFRVDEPVSWTVFESELKPISINYPKNWIASNLPQGYGSDKEIIGSINPLHPDYPWLYIANRKMQADSLETVADWGESRINTPERNLTIKDYTTDSLETITVNEEEAMLRKYHYLDHWPQRIDCYHIYLLDGGEAYTIEMCVNEKNDSPELRSVWEHMIYSITFSTT